jgi:REP element-mobilizing transposase RayT
VFRMSQTLSRVGLHLIFSTKNRKPDLANRDLRVECHGFLGGLCNTLKSPVVSVGGVEDHVHVACILGRSIAISDLVKELKRESSLWIKGKSRLHQDFQWQAGYAAFSVSPSHLDALITYIQNQEEHHRKESFQDELRRILTIYELEWDERYLWD